MIPFSAKKLEKQNLEIVATLYKKNPSIVEKNIIKIYWERYIARKCKKPEWNGPQE